MSNLIKSVYFQMDQDDTRVIDSDHQMVQFVPQLLQTETVSSEADPESQEEGFQGGMNVLNLDDVRREEREKMQEETSQEREELLAQAHREAQEIVQRAQEEASQIREQAQEEGRNEGFEQGQAQAQERLQEAALKLQKQMEKERQELKEQEKALEPKYAEIMAALIEKITGVICSDKKW